MAGGLRFRSEATLVSSLGTPYTVGASPITLIAANQVLGIQKAAIYRFIIEAVGAATIQFQDTGGTPISAQFSLLAGGSMVIDTPINGDYWYIASAARLGLQLLLTGTGPVAADVWIAMGA
jgi:hypothetical protein